MIKQWLLCAALLASAGIPQTLAQQQGSTNQFVLTIDPPENSFIVSVTNVNVQFTVTVSNMNLFTNVSLTGIFGNTNMDLTMDATVTNAFLGTFPAPIVNTATNAPFTAIATGDDLALVGMGGGNGENPAQVVTQVQFPYLLVPPPLNDNMTNAFKIDGIGGIVTGVNHFARKEQREIAHAGVSVAGASLWWKWSSPIDTDVLVDLAGTDFDGIIGVYTGSDVARLTQVASGTNDVINGLPPHASFFAERGVTYRIAVASFGQPPDVIPPLPVPPPDPTNPMPSAGPQPDTGGITGNIRLRVAPGATPDTRPPSVFIDGADRSLNIETSTVVLTGTARDQINDSGVSDIYFHLDGQAVTDAQTAISGDSQSSVTWQGLFDISPGSHVLEVFAEDFAGNVSVPDSVVIRYISPLNDLFKFSLTLPNVSGLETANNVFSTREEGEPFHANNDGGHSVWYNWKAPADGQLQLSTEGSDFDTLLAVYQGEKLDELTPLSSNDDALSGSGYSSLVQTAVSNEVYQIAVDGFGGEAGNIVLNYVFDSTITENFFNININKTAGGSVSPQGGAFPQFSRVTLTALPQPDFTFVGWEGSVTGMANPLAITVVSNMTLTPHFTAVGFTDDFETGDLSKIGWEEGGSAGWQVVTNDAGIDLENRIISGGDFKAQSQKIDHNQTSELVLEMITGEGTGSFDVRVSCEENWDFLEFRLNGEVLRRWTGEQPWANFQFPILEGSNELRWVYRKDGSFSEGLDAGFIDNFYVPPAPPSGESGGTLSIVMFPEGAQVTLEALPNIPYIIEASENLKDWEIIDRKQSVSGVIHVLDTEAPGLNARYYRSYPE